MGCFPMIVSEQFLYVADVRTILQHVGCTGSSERMESHGSFDVGFFSVVINPDSQVVPGQRFTGD